VLLLLTTTAVARAQPAQRTRDIIYGRKYGLALTMDVFRPAKANGVGLIFLISGGYESSPDAIRPELGAEFFKRGYTVFAVVHGSQPKFTVPEIVEDVHRAVRFIRYHAKDYDIDPDRLGVGGASSGGLLSLLLGTTGGPGDPKAKDPVDRASSKVQCVACFYPVTDFLNYGKKGNELLDVTVHPPEFRAVYDDHRFDAKTALFERITDKDEIRNIKRKISPIYHVTKESAPTLIIHGDKDELVPIQQSELILAKFEELGVPSRLVVKKGHGHGWFTLPLDLPKLADWFDEHLCKGEKKPSPSCPAAASRIPPR
jgi:acetyl esterase/lipase